MLIDPNNPATALRANKELFTGMQTVLCGMLEGVPEQFKPGLTALKDKVDKALVALAGQPTDQVPAAQMAGYSIQQLCESLKWMKELYDSSLTSLGKLMADLAPKEVALHGWETRLANGELIEKAAAETALKAATQKAAEEAVAGERARVALLGTRRTQLASAKLPLPEETLLEGTDEAFTALQTTAQTRLAALEKAGISTQLNDGAALAGLLYGPETQFTAVVNLVGSLAPKQPAEPLAGGTAPAAAKPPRPLVAF